MMTKTEERKALDSAKERIQERFTNMFGFAPCKGDIRPLECSYIRFMDAWIVDSLGFHVNGQGWVYTTTGEVEKADQYNMNTTSYSRR